MANGDDFTVGIGNKHVAVHGVAVIFVLLSACLAGLMIFHASQASREHADLIRELRIQTYVLTLPNEQRPTLIFPDGLEGRLVNGKRPHP